MENMVGPEHDFHKCQSRLVNYLEYRIPREQRVNIPTSPCLPEELTILNLLNVLGF